MPVTGVITLYHVEVCGHDATSLSTLRGNNLDMREIGHIHFRLFNTLKDFSM